MTLIFQIPPPSYIHKVSLSKKNIMYIFCVSPKYTCSKQCSTSAQATTRLGEKKNTDDAHR